MSRSLRHTPIVPVANVSSEKDDKKLAHHRERRWVHDHLSPTTATVEDFDIQSHRLHPHSGRAEFSKDGREFIGTRAKYDDPALMRK